MDIGPTQRIKQRKPSELTPSPNNSRQHSDAQIDQIVASIEQFGFTIPVLIDEKDMIIAGHGRVMAAERMGLKEVPTIRAERWSEAQKRAYIIADNKLTENSSWDFEMLRSEITALRDMNFEIEVMGFTQEDQVALFADEPEPDFYTRKIERPIYKPSDKAPDVADLFDSEKSDGLINEVAKSKLPDDVKDFLIRAAQRHTVFDFQKIADFYAHADKKTQRLMEKSALVIIDFDQAISEGFVKLAGELGKVADKDKDLGGI